MNVSSFFSNGQTPAQLAFFTITFILCWNLEWLYGVTQNYRRWSHDATNFLFMLPGAAIQVLLAVVFIKGLSYINNQHLGLLAYFQISGALAQVTVVFIVLDFTYYVYHFLMHKVKIVWPFHAVHHSDPVLNVSTSLREHPVETLIRIGHYTLVVWMLAPAFWIVTMHQFIQIVSKIIIHSNFRLPERVDKYVSWVFLTPNMHHVHHHYQEPYTDSNYGDLFSVWDRMFGTYRHLPAHEVQFGLDIVPSSEFNLKFIPLMGLPFDKRLQHKPEQTIGIDDPLLKA